MCAHNASTPAPFSVVCRAPNWKCIEYGIGPLDACACCCCCAFSNLDIIIAIIPENTSKTLISRKFMRFVRRWPDVDGFGVCVRAKCNTSLLKRKVNSAWSESCRNKKDERHGHTWLCGQSSNLHCNFGVHEVHSCVRIRVWASLIWFRYLLFMWFILSIENVRKMKATTPQNEFGIFANIVQVKGVLLHSTLHSIQLSYSNATIIFNEIIECKHFVRAPSTLWRSKRNILCNFDWWRNSDSRAIL